MADIANQLEGAVEGLDRFLEALDNSSMKLGSNAAIESKLARGAAKKADQELRFRKKVEKMEKEIAKREAQHLVQLKAAEPLRKKVFASLKQELKAKSDLIKQTKGLGDALKKTGAGLGAMFKALGKGIANSMKGLGAGFKGGISSGLGKIMEGLKGIEFHGYTIGKLLGIAVTAAKTLYDVMMNYRNLQMDLVRQTGQFVDNTGKITTEQEKYVDSIMKSFKVLGDYGYELKDVVKMTQELREAFGDVSYVTNDLVIASAELQISYRMAGDEANNLVVATERAGFGVEGLMSGARAFHKTMKETAIVMGADVGMAMRDAAKNSQMIELYAGRGAEYFARMATRAVMLGTSMSSLEKTGDIFADFDQAADAVGRMSYLFGAGFEDGLKDLTELRMMWETGDMLGIQEHIAEQVGKTLKFEDGILISRRTGAELMRSQIQAHAKLMSTDEVTAKRMIETGALVAAMKKEGFDLDKERYKEIKEAYESEYDFVLAMKGTTGKTNQELIDIIGGGREGIGALLAASQKEIERRTKEAKDAADLPKQTLAQMSALTLAMNEAAAAITAISVEAGESLEKSVGIYIKRFSAASGAMTDSLSEGLTGWMKGDDKSLASLTKVFKDAGGAGLEEALPSVFAKGSNTDRSFAGMVEHGLVAALGGEKGAGLWDVMKERMMEAWDYGVEKFWQLAYFLEDMFDVVGTEIGIKINSALDDLPWFEKYTKQQEDALRKLVDLRKESREYKRSMESKYYDEQGAPKPGATGPLEPIPRQAVEAMEHERSRQAEIKSLKEVSGTAERMTYGQWSDSPMGDPFRKRRKELNEMDFGFGGFGQVDGKRRGEWEREIRADSRAAFIDYSGGEKQARWAKGYAGAAHRGIVGEAGTEVGITKNALRELASAGIPGYQNGSNFVRWATDTEGLTSSAGGGLETRRRQDAAQRSGDVYRESINRFEQDFLNIPRRIPEEIGDVWARDTKEFFTKYPAVVDEAIGAPFRQAGPVATGLYNSVFSGMQAATRAELAGADKDTQRQLMYQHAVAEGLKEDGTIDQTLKWLGGKQDKISKTFNGGLEIEIEQSAKLGAILTKSEEDVRNQTAIADQATKDALALQLGRTEGTAAEIEAARLAALAAQKELKSLKNIENINQKQFDAQQKTVEGLQKLKARGEVWNRLYVGMLGGIQQGLQQAAATFAATGDYDRAKEMGKRGLIGGVVQDLTGTFGKADPAFLGTMNTLSMLMGVTPLPPYAGKDAGQMLATAMQRTEDTFQSRGRGLDWGGGNAQGRVYTSPHLAMVGEGSQNEVIIPTERIRKGLPINAGVARELGSIGVPGYWMGYDFMKGDTGAGKYSSTQGMVGFGGRYEGGGEFMGGRGGAAMHNIKSGAGVGIATAGMQFAQMYQATGDMGYSAGQALGAGLGMAATAGLTPFLGPFAPLAGGLIGSFIGNKLGKWMAYKPKYTKYRERALKNIEEHVLTKGRFMPAQPSGIKTQISKAISGGKEKHPTDKAMNKMVEAVADSTVLGYGLGEPGMGAETLLALLAGQAGGEAPALYKRYNKIFYGNEMAKGGIVTKPTRAIIGEKGPEAVIPLDQHSGYASRQQMEDQKNIITELRKQNQQMGMFIKKIGDGRTVLQVDGRTLAETVGANMYDIGSGL